MDEQRAPSRYPRARGDGSVKGSRAVSASGTEAGLWLGRLETSTRIPHVRGVMGPETVRAVVLARVAGAGLKRHAIRSCQWHSRRLGGDRRRDRRTNGRSLRFSGPPASASRASIFAHPNAPPRAWRRRPASAHVHDVVGFPGVHALECRDVRLGAAFPRTAPTCCPMSVTPRFLGERLKPRLNST